MASTWLQTKVIINKNLKTSMRSGELWKQNLIPIIAAALNIYSAKNSDFAGTGIGSLYLPIAIIGYTRSFMYSLIQEKTEKYKQTQKIMGLRNSAYVLGWQASSYVRGIVVCLFFLVPCIIFNAFDPISAGKIIFFYLLYFFASLHQCYFLTSFFDNPKTGADVSTIIQSLASCFFYLLYVDYVKENEWLLCLMSLFPQVCIQLSFIGDSTMQKLFGKVEFSEKAGIIMFSFCIIYYFLMYLYLDQILPNEYGTQKHPLFFLKCFKTQQTQQELKNVNQNTVRRSIEQSLVDPNNDGGQDYSNAIYHEKLQNQSTLTQSIKIHLLEKKFGEFVAVDQVTFQLYQGQIFCLLGHNGAGKTTTVSLLTGLIPKTGGTVRINGLDLDENADEIRISMGLCTQKDVLYDNLTVIEHLRFFGLIQGKSDYELDQEIPYIVEKCALQAEQGKYAKNLSGGNQRKLSMANALVGGSKIVFLDEPTSGMDPVSRQAIWDIMEQLKKEKRTIVLTTHHLDQAEQLAQRVAIMAKGRLLTLGTSEFIKKKFGIGYHLVVQSGSSDSDSQVIATRAEQSQDVNDMSLEDQNWVINLVSQLIPESKFNPQSAKNTLVFTLPFATKNKFLRVFQGLETKKNLNVKFEIKHDAFINIGMDEDRFLKHTLGHKTEEGKEQDQNEQKVEEKEKYTDFSEIVAPEVLSRPPTYEFVAQVKALFMRKYFCTVRSLGVFISFFFPLIYIVLGIVICKLVLNSVVTDNPQTGFLIVMLIMAIFTTIAFAYTTSTIVGHPVMERQQRQQYALNVMGCRQITYWVGTFLFDYGMFFMVVVVFIIAFLSANFPEVGKNIGYIIGILLCFGFPLTTFSYVISFAFQKYQTAVQAAPTLNFIVFWALPLFFYQLAYTHNANFVCYLFLFISPFLNLYFGLTFMGMYNIPGEYQNNGILITNPFIYMLFFIAQGTIFFGITILLENRRHKLLEQIIPNDSDADAGLDPDIQGENKRVANSNDIIRVQKLTKTYHNGFTAIRDNTFGVNQGEIFGLLGPNGAGQSSTFNILTSLISKTSGSVKLQDQEVNSGIMDIYQYVGICPQFDPIWENLTVKEHLMVYGSMQGLQGGELADSILYFLRVMQLTDYVDKRAGQLSGGNKRKLCVTLALIGGPDMQFFDEPSSGVDPIARRFLWNTMQQSLKLRDAAIVLTTHSMHEAQTLCSKIGILINGKFKCIGSPEYLKQRFGNGYRITIVSDTLQTLSQLMKREFPNCTQLLEKKARTVTFTIPYADFTFSKAFGFMEQQIESGLIQDFEITQNSLEQIFLYFAQFQENHENILFKEPTECLCFTINA